MSDGQILVKVILWAVFVPLFLAAVRDQKLASPSGRRAWLAVFLICTAGSLWGADTEAAVDRQFSGLPVAIFLKAICILLTFSLYYGILREGIFREVGLQTIRFYRLLDRLAAVSVIVMTGGFVLTSLWRGIAPEDLRYGVNAIRDGVALLYIVPAIIPGSFLMWQREKVPPMRFKHLVGLIFIGAFGVVCAGNVLALPLKFAAPASLVPLDRFLGTFVYLCFVCFAILLIPISWLAVFSPLTRVYTYYRLRRLEKWVLAAARKSPIYPRRSWRRLLGLGRLELAIYQATIAILDDYPALRSDPAGQPIYAQIRALVQAKVDYADLVKGIAAIR